jgi:hypothetical protein
MKKQLHTSPVAQAFLSQDECPFCRLEKEAEQRAIRFFAGPSASYMEPQIRGLTNQLGFCPSHLKKLYDYGNVLGNALMLQSHIEYLLLELDALSKNKAIPEKKGLFKKKSTEDQPIWLQLQHHVDSCAICQQVQESTQRDYQVFFELLSEPEFRGYVENCKGFCMPHFAQLLQQAQQNLAQKDADWFYPAVYKVMRENLQRVNADLELLIAKHDYRNAALDWGNARDSVPRAIQKLGGVDPTAEPYRKP